MIGMMKWILITIFIFVTFGTTDKHQEMIRTFNIEQLEFLLNNEIDTSEMKSLIGEELECQKLNKKRNDAMKSFKTWTESLCRAAHEGDEEKTQLLLNEFPNEDNAKFVFPNKDNAKLIDYMMKDRDPPIVTAIHTASLGGNERVVKLLLNAFSEDENEKLIEYVMKDDEYKNTGLTWAASDGHIKIVMLLLDVFPEKEKDKLIEYVMKNDNRKNTALHYASKEEYEKIVTLLLNAFPKDENAKLIEYLIKEDETKNTALHLATYQKNEEIVKLLLDAFPEKENEKLIEYLMKENEEKNTALHLASKEGHEKIVKLLSQKQTNAINEIILCDLRKVTQMFNKQNQGQKENSLLWYLFEDNCCGPGKETILKFLITDYSKGTHFN